MTSKGVKRELDVLIQVLRSPLWLRTSELVLGRGKNESALAAGNVVIWGREHGGFPLNGDTDESPCSPNHQGLPTD